MYPTSGESYSSQRNNITSKRRNRASQREESRERLHFTVSLTSKITQKSKTKKNEKQNVWKKYICVCFAKRKRSQRNPNQKAYHPVHCVRFEERMHARRRMRNAIVARPIFKEKERKRKQKREEKNTKHFIKKKLAFSRQKNQHVITVNQSTNQPVQQHRKTRLFRRAYTYHISIIGTFSSSRTSLEITAKTQEVSPEKRPKKFKELLLP